MLRDLITDSNENWVTAFRALSEHVPGGEVRSFGDLTAISTGIPVPFANPIYVFEPPVEADLHDAISWVALRGFSFQVTVAEPALAETEPITASHGLKRADGALPGMALASLGEILRTESPVDIERVKSAEDMQERTAVLSAAYEMPMELAKQFSPASMATDDRMTPLLGRVDGEPVASGLLVQSGDVAGVYNICVTEAFRRQGIGEAMSWAVLRAGRDTGAEVGVLQSTALGYPLYERMGFETVVEYHRFHPAE
jgi:GNAT superfamily N-acetyltransferase